MAVIERIAVFYVLPIMAAFGGAFVLHWVSDYVARWLMPFGRLARRSTRNEIQQAARHETLVTLVSGIMSVTGFVVAIFVTLAQFVAVDTLVWLVGFLATGFGFSAKPFIADYLQGIAFLANDVFDVGEKVEIMAIEGVVEDISLRLTTLRGINGEVYTIPNGEIRTVRNFSRGEYTPIRVTVHVPSGELSRVIPILEELGQEAPTQLPDLLEPWKVIAQEGQLGTHTRLMLVSKAVFGKGATTRPRILALVQRTLAENEVELAP